MKKIIYWALGLAIGGFLLIQFVPYGRSHTNPPVLSEPAWDSPETRVLAQTACFDCHSNETDWSPWYTKVAPASWLVVPQFHRMGPEGQTAGTGGTLGSGTRWCYAAKTISAAAPRSQTNC